MSWIWSYNDALRIKGSPDNYQGAYMRGANVWLRKPSDGDDGLPRDCQFFFLREGLIDGWAKLTDNLKTVKALDKPAVFRIIEWRHVPAGWPALKANGDTFVDFRKQEARDKYAAMLRTFEAGPGRLLYAVDIPFPFGRSNEPDTHAHIIKALGDGNTTKGEAEYMKACQWVIDLYVEVFGRKCVGNIGGQSKRAEILIPHQVNQGVRWLRQDAFGRYVNGRGNQVGENRASMYDQRLQMAGGRDAFDRLWFEVAGNGIEQEAPEYPESQMFGRDGEYYFLVGTDLGNMGHPYILTETNESAVAILEWESYAWGAPGDGGDGPPPEPDPEPDPTLEERVRMLEIQWVKIVDRLDAIEAYLQSFKP
jgi:hypothetical protein